MTSENHIPSTATEIIRDLLEAIAWKGKTDWVRAVEGNGNWPPEIEAKIAELERERLYRRIIKSHPGSGKTRETTTLVDELWREHGKRGLYLMLSHDAINEVMSKGEWQWAHWEGHEGYCDRYRFASAGYRGRGKCTCGRQKDISTEGPAIGPIEYILADDLGGAPLAEEIFGFDFWVIDEIDLRRFLGKMTVSAAHLAAVAQTHADEPIKALTTALLSCLSALRPEGRLGGKELYQTISTHLDLEALASELKAFARIRDVPFDRNNLVTNFPPRLVPIFLEEADCFLGGRDFNPRVHLVHNGDGGELRIWWRKHIAEEEIEPAQRTGGHDVPPVWHHPLLVVLDASADVDLLAEVLDSPIAYPFDEPEWPANVHVSQYADATLGRSSMGLYPKSTALSPRNKAVREGWYERIVSDIKALPEFDPAWPIGLITFNGIENVFDMVGETREYLTEAGLRVMEPEKPLYYYNLRGSNELEHVKVLVLLGSPIPAPDDFLEEAQAFFSPYDVVSGASERERPDALHMADGSEFPVQVRGYVDDRLQRYFEQKTRAELYQAVHRIRPHLVETDDERFVLIYTNMPVPGVKVEMPLVSEKTARIMSRKDDAILALKSHLETHEACTVPELATLIATEEDNLRSITTWLSRHGPKLAGMVGATFEKGERGRPSRFATSPIIYEYGHVASEVVLSREGDIDGANNQVINGAGEVADEGEDGEPFEYATEISVPRTRQVAAQYRQHQQRFKKELIQRYGPRCALCNVDVVELLEAAHIIPKSEKGPDDARNGLLLCVLHHRAFDAGFFVIEPETTQIHFRESGPDAEKLKFDYLTLEHLPKQPRKDSLEWRWREWDGSAT